MNYYNLRKQAKNLFGRLGVALIVFIFSNMVVMAANPPPVQTYYVPFPEDDIYSALKAIASATTGPMISYISIAVLADDTRIYYDQWENGFDAYIADPDNIYSSINRGGTQIWGDGVPSNGFPPGYTNDVLSAGDVITLFETTVPHNKRASGAPYPIHYDGGDKIASSKPIALTRAGWAATPATLLAYGNEVYSTDYFGTDFISPVGTDIVNTDQLNIFEYVGFCIMAGPNGATISVDKDNDGVWETQNVVLPEGGTFFVNGGVRVGGKIKSVGLIQVELVTGDIGSTYEGRQMRLFPTKYWASSYTTPVSTRSQNGTTVWLYNKETNNISVDYIYRTGVGSMQTNNLTVPAGSYYRQVLPDNTAARFVAPNGEKFYAITAVDSTNTGSGAVNQSSDWGMTLIPDDALTQQALVGLGLGRDPTSGTNPNENGSPIWVTLIGNGNTPVTVYVDYDSDPETGAYADTYGNKYDVAYDLMELQQLRVLNNVNNGTDNTRILVYTLDTTNVYICAAWGQDPSLASPGAPGVDIGTGIPPLPLYGIYKQATLFDDLDGDGFVSPGDVLEYRILIENTGRQPVTDLTLFDNLPPALKYLDGTTLFIDHSNQVYNVSDNGVTPFPVDEDGYELPLDALPVRSSWQVVYHTKISDYKDLPPGFISLNNTASLNNDQTTYSNELVLAVYGHVGDYVWHDLNGNGYQDFGEPGLANVTVRLLDATTGEPVLNANKQPIEAVSDSTGYYRLNGVPEGDYMVEFVRPAGFAFTTYNNDGGGVDSATNSVADTSSGRSPSFHLDIGESKTTLDAGFIPASGIGDRVWVDINENGIQDPGEPGLNGVIVKLLDASGNPVTTNGAPVRFTTVNDPNTGEPGYYFFDDLQPGDYRVAFELPGGGEFTQQSGGVNVGNNSDADPVTGITAVFTLNANERMDSVDAGVKPQLAITKSNNISTTLIGGETITYTVVVTNRGPQVQTNVKVVDILPTGVTFVNGSQNAVLSAPANVISGSANVTNNTAGSNQFTVPYGVKNLKVETWGGGGRGGTRSGNNGRGGGGGGGAYASSVLPVTQGTVFTMNVGAGSATTDAGDDSWFSPTAIVGDAYVLAKGGNSVANNSNNGANGGSAASSIGTIKFSGGNGANSSNNYGGGGGSSAGSAANGNNANNANGATAPSDGGNGGNGATSNNDGNPGVVPGGGGGGAYRTSGTRNGGAGGDGQVVLSYDYDLRGTTGNAPNLATGWTIPVGETLTITYQVTLDTPVLDNEFINIARVTSAMYTQPLQDESPVPAEITPVGVIGDRIWLDENGDGEQDAGEDGIANVKVELLDDDGKVIATTWTDSEGYYIFKNIYPGTYTVRVDTDSMPAGLAANPTYDYDDTDTPHQATVTVGKGETFRDADFGYNWAPPSDTSNGTGNGAIGDRVWIDANGDGIQDPGEPGLAGIEVQLYNDPAGDGLYTNLLATAVTDANGNYIFDDLPAGSYVIVVNDGVTPSGYTLTGDPDYFGQSVPTGKDDNKTTSPIVLAPGDVYVNADFGYQPESGTTGEIGKKIWLDLDGNGSLDDGEPGIPGVTVVLKDQNGKIIATTVTDENGEYLFKGLPTGKDYAVEVTDVHNVLDGLVQTYDKDGIITPGKSTVTNLTPAGDNTQNFGYTPKGQIDEGGNPTNKGVIGDRIWHDKDGNGDQDPDEPGIPGVVVNLYDSNTNLITSVITDENGNYYFGGLEDGTYIVRVDTNSLPNGGTGMTNSGDPDGGTPNESSVIINGSNTNLDQDFGYKTTTPNTIGGTIWEDRNADGTLNPAETNGLAGITVVLYDGNGKVVGKTTTDENGNYEFTDLPDGDYTIVVTDENHKVRGWWKSNGPNPGDDNNSQTNNYTVSVSGGEINTTGDFGFYFAPAALGNFVWEDLNNNGIQDPGEPGIEDVKVTLTITYPNNEVVTVVTQTDDNGFYSFGNLLLDEDYNGLGSGQPLYEISVESSTGEWWPAELGKGTAATDSDDHDGVEAEVVQGEYNDTYDFGYYQNARIHGYTFTDVDQSLTRNEGDQAAGGMHVELWLNGIKIAETNSAENGYYEFENLKPGDYQVRFYGSLSHLIDVPDSAHAGYEDEERNRAEPDATHSYGVLTHTVPSGYGYRRPDEPLNAGFKGTGPMSSEVDLRAYAAADGVYVEFAAYEVTQDGEITLYLFDKKGNIIWSGTVEVTAGPRYVARFKVPGLSAGQAYDFKLVDEGGKNWVLTGVKVGSMTAEMIAMLRDILTLRFSTLPGRTYEVQRSATPVGPWQTVKDNVLSDGEHTTIAVDRPVTGSGFFRLKLKE